MAEGKRIVAGFIANGYSLGVTVATQLLLVPFFISAWGVDLYGEWLVLIALPMYIAVSDLGFTNIAANAMSMLSGKQQDDRVRQLFASAWYFSLLMCAVSALGLFAVFWFLKATGVYRFSLISPELANRVFALYVLYMCLNAVCNSTTAIYRYALRYALSEYLLNSVRLLETVATALLLVARQDMTTVLLAMIAIRIPGMLLMLVTASRISTGFSVAPSRFSLRVVRELALPSISFTLYAMGVILYPQALLIGLGSVFAPSVIVAYSTSKTLARFGYQLLSAWNRSVSVELSHLAGRGNFERIFTLTERSIRGALLASLAWCSAGALVAQDVVRAWTKADITVDPVMFLLVSAIAFVQAIWTMLYTVYSSANQHGTASLQYVAIAAASLLVIFGAPLPASINVYLAVCLLAETMMLLLLAQGYLHLKQRGGFAAMPGVAK